LEFPWKLLIKISYQSGFKVKSDFGQFRVDEKTLGNWINFMQHPDFKTFMASTSSVSVKKHLFTGTYVSVFIG